MCHTMEKECSLGVGLIGFASYNAILLNKNMTLSTTINPILRLFGLRAAPEPRTIRSHEFDVST
jgi:hypothetical protein